MNLKKISVCGLFLALVGCCFMSSTEAQEAQVVQIKTITIQPLKVDFNSVSKGVIRGEISGKVTTTELQTVVFRIENHPEKDEIWRESIPWDNDFSVEGNIDIPFQFDVSEIAIADKFVFAVDLLDKKGSLIATGQIGAQAPKDNVQLRTSNITDLTIQKSENVQVSVLFTNGKVAQKVRPELTLTEHAIDGDVVFVLNDEAFVSVGENEQKTFSLSFSVPTNPENYIVSVRMIDARNDAVTGFLRDSFLVEGDFAEIKTIQVTPDKVLSAGETVEFSIFGVADGNRGPLEMSLTALIMPQKEGVAPLQETRSIVVSEDSFAETFAFNLPVSTKEFNITAQLSRDGKMIEEKNMPYSAIKQSAKSLLDIQKEVVDRYSDGGFEVWMILVFALAVIVLFVSLLHRKKRLNLILLLVLPFLGISSASAAWVASWQYPLDGETFNHQSTDGFETMIFMGSISDSVSAEGYFQTFPTAVYVEFTKGAQTASKIISVEDVQILNKADYKFPIDLSDPELSNLDEGNWDVQVTFNGTLQTSWEGSVWLDTTPPNISFAYTPNTFTNSSVAVDITCTDTVADCLQEASGESEYAPFDVTVLGNFADSYENGPRGFVVCDKVGNCTSSDATKLIIDFYDPISPGQAGLSVNREGLNVLNGTGGFANNIMAAIDSVDFSLSSVVDPTESDSVSQDTDACGDANSDTYLNGTFCTPKWSVCPVNFPAGGGGPERIEVRYDNEENPHPCEDGVWIVTDPCGFAFTFPFTLEECTTCPPVCTCADTTCIGSTCDDGCGGTCDGTLDCGCTDNCSSPIAYECGSQTICGTTTDCGPCGDGEICNASGICEPEGCVENGCEATTCVGSTCDNNCDPNAAGTMESTTWTPDLDSECEGVPFTQTGTECGETREAIGTGTGAGCCVPDTPCPAADRICIGENCTDSCENRVDGTMSPLDGGWADWIWSCSEGGEVAQGANLLNPNWLSASLIGQETPPGPLARIYGTRTCDNPEAQCGGADCVGVATMTIPCEEGEICRDGSCAEPSCTADSSCAASTCIGSTCTDSCGNVYDGTLPSQDGGWTVPWSAWTCSSWNPSTALVRSRSCTNPSPACGGANCEGNSTEIDACDAGEICSNNECITATTYYWNTGDWGTCSLPNPLDNTCNGTETRTVLCKETASGNTVDDSNCTETKPDETQGCVAVDGTSCGTTGGGAPMVCNDGVCTSTWNENECFEECRDATTVYPYSCSDLPVSYWDNYSVGTACTTGSGSSGECDGNGVCVASVCSATTMDHCDLPETSSGGTAGSCDSTTTGACEYACNAGTWEANSNSCVCTTHDHKDCYSENSWWYNSCDDREDQYAECQYGCTNGICDSFSCGDDEMYDQEGNSYATNMIGTQCWMKEDLATDEDENGNALTSGVSGEYRTDGGDYFYTLDASLKVCPSGWHLATDSEWKTLESQLGMASSHLDALDWRGGEGNELETEFDSSMPGHFNVDGNRDGIPDHHFWTSTLSGTGAFCASYAGGNPKDIICYYDRQITNYSYPSGANDQIRRLKRDTGEPNDYLKLSVRCLKDGGGGGGSN